MNFLLYRNNGIRDIDPGWSHGEAVGSKTKIKCNYCGKIVNGGITRLKQHLAHVSGQVINCPKVPPNVRAEMQGLLKASAQKKVVQERRRTDEFEACREEVFGGSDDDDDEDPELTRARRESVRSLQEEEERRRMQYEAAVRGSQYEQGGSSGSGGASLRRAFSHKQPRQDPDIEEVERPPTQAPRRPAVVGPTDPFAYRKPTSKQPGIIQALKGKFGKARDNLVRATGKFFLDGGIPPNKASSPYFTTMLDAAAEHGPGIKAPTPYEIGHICVEKEYDELQAWVQTFKWAWKERGCTLMCDGWTTITHRHLLNFLVYSSMGTVFIKSIDVTDYIQDAKYINRLLNDVIEEIGADCIVQVVTDNAANTKAA